MKIQAGLAIALMTYGLFTQQPAVAAVGPRCSASAALNAVADALTSGQDAHVLRAALDAERTLRSCGNERDSIGAELVAADAYGDTSQPQARCRALSDAARRSAKLGDTARAGMIRANACGAAPAR
jgi:hypothetical protein